MPRKSILPFFVALYYVQRRYGGPEEGGWYYNAGVRKSKVKVFQDEQTARKFVVRAEKAMAAWHQDNDFPLWRCDGRYDVEVYRDPPPPFYPLERPYYE